MKNRIINFFNWLKELSKYDLCDSCGFTKDKCYVVELYSEAGFRECTKCINKKKEKQS